MSEDLVKGVGGEPDRTLEEIFGLDPQILVGKTITGVKVEGRYQRVEKLRLAFDDGLVIRLRYWASYADDASLEVETVRDSSGETEGGAQDSQGDLA